MGGTLARTLMIRSLRIIIRVSGLCSDDLQPHGGTIAIVSGPGDSPIASVTEVQ